MREVFLSEGYLFEDVPDLAIAITKEILLPDLFDEGAIYRLRDNEVQLLTRKDDRYVEPNGEEASIYLNDRTATTPETLHSPLHLDAAAVRKETGAQRILPMIVGTTAVAVKLIFPSGNQFDAFIVISNDRTTVECIDAEREILQQEMNDAAIFWGRHYRIQAAALQLIAERPLFDEPSDEAEDVQEDGELRLAWKDAYYSQKKKFMYREVEYNVFDRQGHPIPPEVCVDFIFDTWERAFGTWYTNRKSRPQKTEGDIDFSVLPDFSRRHIATILTYAGRGDTPFKRFDVPRRKWIPLLTRRLFVKNLSKLSDYIRDGDLLVIHGLKDEDEQEHFHTVLVLSTDPLTGIPTLVADNQGRPRISTLKTAMRAAPRRSIKFRLRVDFDQMIQFTAASRELAASHDTDSSI